MFCQGDNCIFLTKNISKTFIKHLYIVYKMYIQSTKSQDIDYFDKKHLTKKRYCDIIIMTKEY